MNNITPTVKQLLIINIIFFIGCQLAPQAESFLALYSFESNKFKVWQIITHMFMHANIMHIFFNMFALVSFGSALEQFWGPNKFLFFYISCGIGAALLHLGINYLELQHLLKGVSNLNLSNATLHEIINLNFNDGTHYRSDLLLQGLKPILQESNKLSLLTEENLRVFFDAGINVLIPMVGASGAVYGLLVAFAFMFPNVELGIILIPIGIKAKYFVPGILLVDLILGLKGSAIFNQTSTGGIAHFAHLGGALIGFIMMWYWKKNQFNKNRWN